MPAMADITVKKYDGTTDIMWSQKNPSAGDTVPAYWRSDSVSGYPGLKPDASMVSRWNGPRTARRVSLVVKYPSVSTDSQTGVMSSIGQTLVTIEVVAPQGVPQTDINEAVAQAINLADSALLIESFRTGFAPT